MAEREGQAAEPRQKFAEQHGYHAGTVPTAWIGQTVAMNIVAGRGSDALLGVSRAGGVLEGVNEDGYIISAAERVVFLPRHAVLHIELYEEGRRPKTPRLG
jgi:hypothetical protein